MPSAKRNGHGSVAVAVPADSEAQVVGPAGPGRLPQYAVPERTVGRIARRYEWIALPTPYVEDGLEVRIWTNFPQSKWGDIASGVERRRVDAMAEVVVDHRMLGPDGGFIPWTDDDGPLPSPAEISMVPQVRPDPNADPAEGKTIEVPVRDIAFWSRCPGDIGSWVVSEVKRIATTLPNWMTTPQMT